ncbi:sugar ABC transporter ATP-binding protein [Devosia algicola]|uniref:Sugar ABC transporter ATP-binding protein n=1 Tax=Devosia algicola TaxID=3026418 RepID=A0ABY7YRC2_9HYPH|nr:sugar ABC transporter ATP-binding protein [Devosia algicola]WDR03884.1 sugar ABC transporter ATP-binding protein [Devosia algicola]
MAPLLTISNLAKRFAGVHALKSVSLQAQAGRVLAVIGENGAGKSTLVKILTGNFAPDAGEIIFDGEQHQFSGPQQAASIGISAIQQEPSLFDDLSVAENIFVGAQPERGVAGIDWRTMRQRSRQLLADIGVNLDPNMLMRNLSVAERHQVSLARALSTDAKLIIFDEPTSALSQSEIRHLYGIVEQLRDQGKAIIFISHKFDEIYRICDDYVVLRDGETVDEGELADIGQEHLISQMVGRSLTEIYPKAAVKVGAPVLEVQNFSHPTEFANIGFQLREREILGFYGLVGSGRTEVMEAIFGLKDHSGTLSVGGVEQDIRRPNDAMAAGIAYVPEDRQRHGALTAFSIRDNISLPIINRLARWGFLMPGREQELVDRYGQDMEIKASSWSQPVAELSGGNQQKVVLGKWLATNPSIIILDEPTKGIDVGTKAAVHRHIGKLVQQGLSVILVSSELEEVLALADRMVVMRQGRIDAVLERADFSPELVMAKAAGVLPGSDNVKQAAR